ncbi:MAG: outer membrane protein transport protein [Holophagales bacterium]|nr:outer membrane protein transport protein [Holophagales bacterium]MBK9965672.1 outer membrane protein transport protein [Holophagales bacterium]
MKRGAGPQSRGPRDSRHRSVALLALLALVPAGERTARAADEPRSFVLTFSNPGARSLAFGGAFAPLADDATAAYANPAGLVQLLRPEVSLELRVSGSLEDDGSGEATVSRANGVSFFSVVYPMHRLSLALYGQQLAGVDVEVADEKSSSLTGWTGRQAPAGERLSGLEVWRVGLSGAFRLRDNLSFGLGVSYFDGTAELAPSGSPSASARSVDSNDWTLNTGALWNPSEQVRLGAFYRQGPSLSLGTLPDAPCGRPECPERSLRLPDTFGAGAALRSSGGALTVAFEWDRVRYSSLVAGLSAAALGTDQLTLSDANEFHVGAEYAFLRVDPVIAVRVGAWLDPDHALCGDSTDSPYPCAAGERSDEVHVTLGFGLAFRRFQLDLAVDGSRSQVTSSISGIFSF